MMHTQKHRHVDADLGDHHSRVHPVNARDLHQQGHLGPVRFQPFVHAPHCPERCCGRFRQSPSRHYVDDMRATAARFGIAAERPAAVLGRLRP
jgi:hypothetical protein